MSACVCGKPKNHCDPCSTQTRRAGRTTAMIRALPVENTPTVVVHTQAMADYVRNLAYRERHDLRHPIRVRVVASPRDADYLRGCDFVVDHAVWEHVSPETGGLLQAMFRPQRLSAVDAKIERKDGVMHVELPGTGWE